MAILDNKSIESTLIHTTLGKIRNYRMPNSALFATRYINFAPHFAFGRKTLWPAAAHGTVCSKQIIHLYI